MEVRNEGGAQESATLIQCEPEKLEVSEATTNLMNAMACA